MFDNDGVKQPIVIKVGGSTLGANDSSMADIAALWAAGERVILVHGGGSAATEWLKIHGVQSEFLDGLRVTGADSLDVVVAVFAGLCNKQIVADLRALGAPAFGLCGVDGGVLETRQMDERLGFVGEITRVNPDPLNALLDAGCMPVLAPVGYWEERPAQLMNVNADTVAGELAAAASASQLIFLTDVASVRGGDGSAISALRPEAVEDLISSGVASGGMIPKLRAGARAAAEGVRCYIVDGRESHALRDVLRGQEMGTLVSA
jgi:acetylglutamate kinase